MINYIRKLTYNGQPTTEEMWATITYDVVHENRVKFGELYMEVDGYYVWDNLGRHGFLPSHAMRSIADKLDELNKEWDYIVQNDPRIECCMPDVPV